MIGKPTEWCSADFAENADYTHYGTDSIQFFLRIWNIASFDYTPTLTYAKTFSLLINFGIFSNSLEVILHVYTKLIVETGNRNISIFYRREMKMNPNVII